MEVAIARQAPFALYLNSKFASASTSTGNGITFSFAKPLYKDPDDLMYVKLSHFTTFNTFTNISQYQGNNILKVLTQFRNNVTGAVDNSNIQTITVPDGRYDINTLVAYLNANCNSQLQVDNTAFTTNDAGEAYLYLGLGFDGSNNSQCTTPILGFVATEGSSRVLVSPAMNSNTSAYLKDYNIGYSISNDPYAYMGVYLLVDDVTEGLMEVLGFTNLSIVDPVIASGLSGYGYQFATSAAPNTDTMNPSQLVSPYVINLAGPMVVTMVADSIQNNSRSSDTFMDQQNVIGEIPIASYYGSIINYRNPSDDVTLVDHLDTVTLVITFYDQNNKLVNFQGGIWTAKLQFTMKSDAKKNLIDQQTANVANTYVAPVDTSYAVSRKKQKANDYGGLSLRPSVFL
jgi:hypothetical protein